MKAWLPFIVILLYGVACALNLMASTPPERFRLRAVSKSFLMPLLALYYALAARFFSPLVLIAVLCGFLGDVLLLDSDKKPMFAGGLAAFAIGHVFYAAYILSRFGEPPAWWVSALAAAPYLLIIVLIMRGLRPHLPRGFFLPCLGYMALLGFMSFCTLLLFIGQCSVYTAFAFIGSLLFMVSDTVLAANAFGVRQHRYRNVLVMGTYIAAQTLLVTGLMLS